MGCLLCRVTCNYEHFINDCGVYLYSYCRQRIINVLCYCYFYYK